jgi:hypothetical protein
LMSYIARQGEITGADGPLSNTLERQQAFVERLIDELSQRAAEVYPTATHCSTTSTEELRRFFRNSVGPVLTALEDIERDAEQRVGGVLVTVCNSGLVRIPIKRACGHFELRPMHWTGHEQHRANGFIPSTVACSQCDSRGRLPQPHFKSLEDARVAAR